MRFMLLMIPKGYETAAPGTMPDPKAVEAMMKYNESLQKAGVLLALDGLHPPSVGARVTFTGGKPRVTDLIAIKRPLGAAPIAASDVQYSVAHGDFPRAGFAVDLVGDQDQCN